VTGAEALAHPPDGPEAVRAVAARCRRVAAQADALASELRRTPAGVWDGVAAAARRREARLVTALAASLAVPLRTAAQALLAHASVVDDARAEVLALRGRYDELVDAHRSRVTATALHDLPGPLRRLLVEDLQTGLQHELAVVTARHRALLDDVRAHAAATAGRIRSAAGDLVPSGVRHRGPLARHEADLAAMLPLLDASRRAVGVSRAPPPRGTPALLVRAWWAALTGDEQDRVVGSHASVVGSLAGLPAAVRSRANEAALDADVAARQAGGARTADEQRWLDTCLVVRDQLARVRARTDPVSREPLVAQLLVFEPRAFAAGERVALAVGDLDRADHVAFLVPGLGSEVYGSLAALTADATRVTTEARRASVSTRTATVAWLGYDAPGLADAGSDGAAEQGADLLAADLLAVQAARDVMPHLTVVGHSYGSTTAGTALRDHVTGADDAVLVGSPGPNVETARELGLPAGHVFVGASSRDPVSYLDRFGADPTHEDFGAYRFQAEDVTRNRYMLDAADHSKYFDPESESLANIVKVVVADYGGLRPAAYRDEVWLLPDGINSDPEADRAPTVVP
jgi:hypothetical protein